MRRLVLLALAAIATTSALACGGDATLAPVQTVDGEWKGTQNGYALDVSMVQSGNTVNCNATIGSNAGFLNGDCVGVFNYPALHITITVPGFLPIDYDATMSQTEAKLNGKLNGSGLSNVEVDIKKV